MTARPVWRGYVRFSLVSLPVKAFTANEGAGKIALNQLHRECGRRIKYQKRCPVHGEVPNEDIISGYEFQTDQYVTIEPEEIMKLRSKRDNTIAIEAFIEDNTIEPHYYSGRMMYLVPDGKIGNKPYAILHRLMVEQRKVAFATGVLSSREQLLLLRPLGRTLAATFLYYHQDIRSPALFEPQVPKVDIDKQELDLARMLINQYAKDKFDFASYRDVYEKALQKLIEAKVAGKKILSSPADAEPQVTNLMEALQRSLDKSRGRGKPPKIASPSTADRTAETKRRRKSS
jgi:DNA end-binding protein Ku